MFTNDPFLYYNHILALICCFVFNITLALCLYTEKRQQLRIYAQVLYIQCFADIIAGVCYYFSAVKYMMIDGIFYFVHIHPFFDNDYIKLVGYDLPTNCVTIYLFLFASGLPISCLPISFYFRYLNLSR